MADWLKKAGYLESDDLDTINYNNDTNVDDLERVDYNKNTNINDLEKTYLKKKTSGTQIAAKKSRKNTEI